MQPVCFEEIDRINQDIPQIEIISIIDTSDYIQRSITNVGTIILYGGVLAIGVLLLFLRNIPSTAVIATTIPISVVATFALMYFNGFTLNLMTLGGLALGVGMLVDNAIVVLENIYRHRESGKDAKSSAIMGSQEVMAAVIASTLTTLAVFMPLIFVRGMSGVMFKQLSYVISFSLGCSLIVALTLVPMLASRIRNSVSVEKTDDAASVQEAFLRRPGTSSTPLKTITARFLALPSSTGFLTVGSAVLMLTGSLFLIPFVGVELMPASDESEVRVECGDGGGHPSRSRRRHL